jgi:hypothetical protein
MDRVQKPNIHVQVSKYFTTLPCLYNVEYYNDWRMAKDFKGSGLGLIEILSSQELQKAKKTVSQDSRYRIQAYLQYEPTVLPVL